MAVEAALVVPLLLIAVIGILEMSMLLKDYLAVTSSVRSGARIASASADAGPGICEVADDAPPCTPASSPMLAQVAADAIQREGSAIDRDTIDYLLVYKANDQGYPGANGNTTMPTSCAGIANCVRFRWRPAIDGFRYAEGSWDSKSVNACVNESDSLGVYLHATHPFITKMFGASMGVAGRSVMRFEPLADERCKPGRPAAHP